MNVACLDLEGVLIPELWPYLAEATGIGELRKTTREVSNYPVLVQQRTQCLRKHNLRLRDVQQLLECVEPLPGALEFVAALSQRFRILLVSDAFFELVSPLWAKFGSPEHRCNRFQCDSEGFIESAKFVRAEGKHEVIAELEALGALTLAVGDALNDLSMLRRASRGFLFRPSATTLAQARDLDVAKSYEEIIRVVMTGHTFHGPV